MTNQAAPGWYDDGHGAKRWWDGTAWTDHLQQPAARPRRGMPAVGVVFLSLGMLILGIIIGTTAAGVTRTTSTPTVVGPVEAPRVGVTWQGDGQMDSDVAHLAGNYRLDWETLGDCFYAGDLEGGRLRPSVVSSNGIGTGTTNLQDLAPGDYYLQMITGPSPDCGWKVTLSPVG